MNISNVLITLDITTKLLHRLPSNHPDIPKVKDTVNKLWSILNGEIGKTIKNSGFDDVFSLLVKINGDKIGKSSLDILKTEFESQKDFYKE